MVKVILIVEDNSEFRETLVELLRNAGYQTLEAGQGKEAIETLSKNKVDIVLTDIKMPVMDGMALLAKIQTLGESRPKVVMMTGYSIYSAEEAIKAGAEALIDKPSIAKSLIEILSTIRFY